MTHISRYLKISFISPSLLLKPETHLPNCWPSEAFGETQTNSGTNLFGVLALLETFGTTRMLSAPIQLAKSEKVGCWPSEPLDTLIDCVLAV